MHRAAHRQCGFTIIESLITLLILAIGLAGVSRLQLELLRAAGQTRHRTEALALAEGQLEALRIINRPSPYTAGDSGATNDIPGTNARFDLDWQITPATLGSHYRIRVTSHWQDREGSHQVALDTIIPATDPAQSARIFSSSPSP